MVASRRNRAVYIHLATLPYIRICTRMGSAHRAHLRMVVVHFKCLLMLLVFMLTGLTVLLMPPWTLTPSPSKSPSLLPKISTSSTTACSPLRMPPTPSLRVWKRWNAFSLV